MIDDPGVTESSRKGFRAAFFNWYDNVKYMSQLSAKKTRVLNELLVDSRD